MIEDSTTWYLGTVGSASSYSYKNAKYTDASGTAITSNVAEAKGRIIEIWRINVRSI